MLNTKLEANINKIVKSSKKASPNVNILGYALAGTGIARITVDVTHTSESRADSTLVSEAIRAKLEGKMAPVLATFHSVSKGPFTDRITGIVSTVRDILPITDSNNLKGFSAYASNMFMDEERDIWVLKKTEAGQVLVKTTGIDDDLSLVNMLSSMSSANFRTSPEYDRMVAQASAVSNAVQGGDFVSYVSADNTLHQGYVVATVTETEDAVILPVSATEEEVVKKAAVTEIHDQDEFPEFNESPEEQVEAVVAAARGIDMEFLLSYYKKLYARSPAFYKMYVERMSKHCYF